MQLAHPTRKEFASLLLDSNIFQKGLAVMREIAAQVQAHAQATPPDDAICFQFGQQYNFSDINDSRFIPASVTEIKSHLEWAKDVELPELTDTRFMGLAASTMTAVRFTAAKGEAILAWRAETLDTISF